MQTDAKKSYHPLEWGQEMNIFNPGQGKKILREGKMKAYKVFRVKDGRLFSSSINDRACIKYPLRKESTGKTFLCPDDKKIWRPIFAYKNLTSARNMKAKLERNMRKKKNLSFHYEIWEVEGRRNNKKFLRGCIVELEYGRYYPAGLPFSSGTIFLRTCTPIKRIE